MRLKMRLSTQNELCNDIRDLTADLLKEACNDLQVEAKLIPLTGEQLQYRSAITGDETRLDNFA